MSKRQEINEAIYAAIDSLNAQFDDAELQKTPDTALVGENATLDSVRLVSLILDTESEIDDRFGVAITLADEKAFSYKNSPFGTVESLGAYIEKLLAEAGHA